MGGKTAAKALQSVCNAVRERGAREECRTAAPLLATIAMESEGDPFTL